MEKSITCRNISKEFQNGDNSFVALQNISIEFQPGNFTSIVGPSGSGNSTFLSLLGTLDIPTKGELLFGNERIPTSSNKLADFRFEHIGFIFQQFHLIPTLTAKENIMAPLFGRKSSINKNKRAQELLELVGLSDKSNSLPSQLSGGQQQRVAIARALINNPSWILADEPTGNLDSAASDQIFQMIIDLHRESKCGIVLVTHDHELARRTDRIITMKDGSILSDSLGEVHA